MGEVTIHENIFSCLQKFKNKRCMSMLQFQVRKNLCKQIFNFIYPKS